MRNSLGSALGLMAIMGCWLAWAEIRPASESASPQRPQAAEAAAPGQPGPTPHPAVAGQAPGLAFVINSGDASVSLFDVATKQELRRVPMEREPHHMALTPDRKSLVVGDTAANEMVFLDPSSGDVQRRVTISDPYQFGYSPDGKWLVVNGLARNQVDIYDVATMALSSRLHVSSMPSHENFSPDSSTVFVSLQGSNSVVAIDLRSGKPVWQAVVGPTPAGVLWHRGKLLVGIMGADYVAVVNPATGKVERRIKTGRGAHVLFVSHDGKLIYVSNRVDGSIVVLDAGTLEEIRRFRVKGGPDDMDFAPDGRIWATLRWAQAVALIDPLTGEAERLSAGRSPHGIWLNTHDALPGRAGTRPGA